MAILSSNLITKYQELADALINEVNPGYIVLMYNTQVAIANPSGEFYTNQLPTLADRENFRTPINESDGRIEEGGNSNLAYTTTTRTIKIRKYWQNKNYDEAARKLNLNIKNDVCKVIAFLTDSIYLSNAKEASIDNRRVKMIRPPVNYGLFEDRYCVSYWEVIGE